jgi:hypothetical protein
MVQQWSVFALSLRSPWSVDEIDMHPTDEVQKFAQSGQSKTAENFKKITDPRTSEQRVNPAHARSQRTARNADFALPSKRVVSPLVLISAERPRSAAPE